MYIQNYLGTPLLAYLELFAASQKGVETDAKKGKKGKYMPVGPIVEAAWTLPMPANNTVTFDLQPQTIQRTDNTGYVMEYAFQFSESQAPVMLSYGLHHVNSTQEDRVSFEFGGKAELVHDNDDDNLSDWKCFYKKRSGTTHCYLPIDTGFDTGRGEAMRFEVTPSSDRKEWTPHVIMRNKELGNPPVMKFEEPQSIVPSGAFTLRGENSVQKCQELTHFWTRVVHPKAGISNQGGFNQPITNGANCKGTAPLTVTTTMDGLDIVIGAMPRDEMPGLRDDIQLNAEDVVLNMVIDEYLGSL